MEGHLNRRRFRAMLGRIALLPAWKDRESGRAAARFANQFGGGGSVAKWPKSGVISPVIVQLIRPLGAAQMELGSNELPGWQNKKTAYARTEWLTKAKNPQIVAFPDDM